MIKVEILFFDGCPNHEPTVRLAQEVMADLALTAEVREIVVENLEDAQTRRFLGSPSVRVNGRDIEPGAEDRFDYSLGCRMYGASGVPAREWMVAALEDAQLA